MQTNFLLWWIKPISIQAAQPQAQVLAWGGGISIGVILAFGLAWLLFFKDRETPSKAFPFWARILCCAALISVLSIVLRHQFFNFVSAGKTDHSLFALGVARSFFGVWAATAVISILRSLRPRRDDSK